MSDAEATTMETASLSDVGQKRKTNQDHCGEFTGAARERLLVLCDGMGGHQGGEVASQLAVAAIGELVAAGGAPADELLRKGFAQAHERLRARAEEEPSLRGMGTTAVALLADGGDGVWVAHTGDSRAYRIRDGRAEPLTEDHSVVAEQLRRGLVTPAEAERLPHNELLHALGAGSELRVDVARHELRSGDRYLLCSDGLWNMVQEHEMAALARELEPAAAVRRLVDLANQRGANDNVTVQIFAFGPPGEAVVAPDEDETERDLAALDRAVAARSANPEAAAHSAAREALAERDVTVVADAASVEEIWARARGVARAQRSRRIRWVAGAAVLIAIVLLGTLAWLRYASLQADLGAAAGASTPDVAAPPDPGEPAP